LQKQQGNILSEYKLWKPGTSNIDMDTAKKAYQDTYGQDLAIKEQRSQQRTQWDQGKGWKTGTSIDDYKAQVPPAAPTQAPAITAPTTPMVPATMSARPVGIMERMGNVVAPFVEHLK